MEFYLRKRVLKNVLIFFIALMILIFEYFNITGKVPSTDIKLEDIIANKDTLDILSKFGVSDFSCNKTKDTIICSKEHN